MLNCRFFVGSCSGLYYSDVDLAKAENVLESPSLDLGFQMAKDTTYMRFGRFEKKKKVPKSWKFLFP